MKLNFFIAGGIILGLASCGGDSLFDGYTKAKESGLHYKFYNKNENGKKVELGSGIYFSYIIATYPKDSVIVDSKKVSQDGSAYTRFALNASSFKGSFEDGFLMMNEGDSASFIVPADSFFLKTMGMNALPAGVKPGDHLKGIFSIKEVKTKAEVEANQKQQMADQEKMMREMSAKETEDFNKYLADNKIDAKPTASGLIYVEVKKGKGANPKPTDIVKVHYTGKLLDGKTFDSSVDRGEPIEFPLNQVIPGWTEGLQLMAKGGKAKLYIPSNIGYGPRGQGPIPPFATLVFDVELIDIKEGPAQPQMPEGHGPNDGHNH